MLKRVKVKHDAVSGFYVDLPTCRMIDGTWLPVVAGKIHRDGAFPTVKVADVLALNPTVEVELPDADCKYDAQGKPTAELDLKKMAARYPGRNAPDV